MNGWFVDSYGIIVGKYTHFPMDPVWKYHFLTYSNDAQAGAGPVSSACFFLGGWFWSFIGISPRICGELRDPPAYDHHLYV